MGAGASSSTTAKSPTSIEQLTNELLTKFTTYISDAVVEESHIESSKECWKMVTDDLSPHFLSLKSQNDESIPSSCLTWFYDSFYRILHEFDHETDSKALYSDSMRVQVRALVAMISTALSIFKNNSLDKITKSLKELSKKHYQRGVRAYQFPIFGEVLMRTFAFCLGEAWTETAKEGWSKIFSVILRIVVPTSLKIEKDNKNVESSTTLKAVSGRSVSTTIPDTVSKRSEVTTNPDTVVTTNPDTVSKRSEATISVSSENIASVSTSNDPEIIEKTNEVVDTVNIVDSSGEIVSNESNTVETSENTLENNI